LPVQSPAQQQRQEQQQQDAMVAAAASGGSLPHVPQQLVRKSSQALAHILDALQPPSSPDHGTSSSSNGRDNSSSSAATSSSSGHSRGGSGSGGGGAAAAASPHLSREQVMLGSQSLEEVLSLLQKQDEDSGASPSLTASKGVSRDTSSSGGIGDNEPEGPAAEAAPVKSLAGQQQRQLPEAAGAARTAAPAAAAAEPVTAEPEMAGEGEVIFDDSQPTPTPLKRQRSDQQQQEQPQLLTEDAPAAVLLVQEGTATVVPASQPTPLPLKRPRAEQQEQHPPQPVLQQQEAMDVDRQLAAEAADGGGSSSGVGAAEQQAQDQDSDGGVQPGEEGAGLADFEASQVCPAAGACPVYPVLNQQLTIVSCLGMRPCIPTKPCFAAAATLRL
jgi:hypothetical protein